MERIVGGSFRLRRKIGAGSFGEIYSAEHVLTHRRVAVKLESVKSRVPQLCYEAKLYQLLQGGTGVPRLFWHGTEELHSVLVIELLGKSLEDLFVKCHRRFTLKTVLMLADQMLTSVEYIHSKNFIHRDIKPDNFVMGIGSAANQLFMIDYGLAKKYCDQHTRAHIPYVEGKSLTGTARYASIGALRGAEQSRRDDLEALGYVWLYLLRGSLPWMGLTCGNQQQKYNRICHIKTQTPFEDLCHGHPSEFVRYFQTIRALQFTERPNYSDLRAMFRSLFVREGFIYDYQYDWNPQTPPLQVSSIIIPPTLSSQLISKREPGTQNKIEQVPQSARPQPQPAAPKKVTLPEAELLAKRGTDGAMRKWTSGIIGSRGKESRPDENRVLPFCPKSKEKKCTQPTRGVTPRRIGRETSSRRTMLPSWMQNQKQGNGQN
jgi:serine/threonine protein kinase